MKKIEKFLLEKFSGKTSNDNYWINDFENECVRFGTLEDAERIETLKYQLKKQCLDWYTSKLIKFTVNSNWANRKNIFCETYGIRVGPGINMHLRINFKQVPFWNILPKRKVTTRGK